MVMQRKDKPTTPAPLIASFANGRPTWTKDLGNNNCKNASDSAAQYGHAVDYVEVFDHAIASITEAEYNDLCEMYEGQDRYHFFRWRDGFYVVGEEAYNYVPNFDPERGRAKYLRAVYGLLMVDGLLRYTRGNIPEELNLLCAYPPDDKSQTDALLSAVAGRWKIERAGVKMEFTVVHAAAYAEISGSIFNVTQSTPDLPLDVKKYKPLLEGRTLACDLGGGSFDLAMIDDGILNMDYAPRSWRSGMNFAINRFKRDFDQKHAAHVSKEEDGLGRDVIRQLFIDPDHEMKLAAGKRLDCSALYKTAVTPIITDIQRAIREYAGNLNGIDNVLLTGGGATLLLNEFRERIFPQFHQSNVLFLSSDKPKDMLKANAQGGLKLLESLKQKALDDARKAGAKKRG